jgi:hypothetical protein
MTMGTPTLTQFSSVVGPMLVPPSLSQNNFSTLPPLMQPMSLAPDVKFASPPPTTGRFADPIDAPGANPRHLSSLQADPNGRIGRYVLPQLFNFNPHHHDQQFVIQPSSPLPDSLLSPAVVSPRSSLGDFLDYLQSPRGSRRLPTPTSAATSSSVSGSSSPTSSSASASSSTSTSPRSGTRSGTSPSTTTTSLSEKERSGDKLELLVTASEQDKENEKASGKIKRFDFETPTPRSTTKPKQKQSKVFDFAIKSSKSQAFAWSPSSHDGPSSSTPLSWSSSPSLGIPSPLSITPLGSSSPFPLSSPTPLTSPLPILTPSSKGSSSPSLGSNGILKLTINTGSEKDLDLDNTPIPTTPTPPVPPLDPPSSHRTNQKSSSTPTVITGTSLESPSAYLNI